MILGPYSAQGKRRQRRSSCLWFLLAWASVVACSPKESQSDKRSVNSSSEQTSGDAGGSCRPSGLGLFDEKTAKLLDLSVLGSSQIYDLCTTNTLMTFVGNSEAMGTIEFRAPLDAEVKDAIERQFLNTQKNFAASIDRAASDLSRALETNDCLAAFEKAFEAERTAGKLPPVSALGAASYDEYKAAILSSIKSYGRILLATIIDGPGAMDSKITMRWYSWKDIQGKATWQADPETHWGWDRTQQKLSQAAVPSAFELNLPRNLASLISQISQVTPNGMPDNAHKVAIQDVKSDFTQILYTFKTHGGLFMQDGTRRPALLDRSLPDSARSVLLFDTHGEQGEILASDLYSPFWSKKTACEAYDSAGRMDLFDAEQCAAGAGIGSVAVGGTAGIDSGFCSNTASAGKGLLFDNAITPFSSAAAEGILHLGEALSYDTQTTLPKGVSTFVLKASETASPDGIVLDSCFGSERVATALEQSMRGWPKPLVTLSNSNPLYFDLLQYGRLNATSYLMLPFLLMLGEEARRYAEVPLDENTDPAERTSVLMAQKHLELLDSLVEHFTGEGITQPSDGTAAPEASYRRIIPKVLFLNTNLAK